MNSIHIQIENCQVQIQKESFAVTRYLAEVARVTFQNCFMEFHELIVSSSTFTLCLQGFICLYDYVQARTKRNKEKPQSDREEVLTCTWEKQSWSNSERNGWPILSTAFPHQGVASCSFWKLVACSLNEKSLICLAFFICRKDFFKLSWNTTALS